MDEYGAPRKRLRASYYSPACPGEPSLSPSDSDFPFRGLPDPTSPGHLAPPLAMETAGSATSDARKDSTLTNTTPSAGKRKAVEAVDLTGESSATTTSPKPSGGGDVIDLTEDSETPQSLSKAPIFNNSPARQLTYQAKAVHPQPFPYLMQYPHPQQYSNAQNLPSPHQLAYRQSYPYAPHSLSPQPFLDQRRFKYGEQYAHPHQYAYARQSPPPPQHPYPNVLMGFLRATDAQPTGTPRGNERLHLQPGAQSSLERSAPGRGLEYRGVHNNVDPRQSMRGGYDVDAAYARQLQDQIDQECSTGASPPSNAVNIAQAQSKPGTLKPHAARALLQSWAGSARRVTCSCCGHPLLAIELNLNLLFKKWFETPKMTISSVLSCDRPSCSVKTCLGCGKRCHTKESEVSAQVESDSKIYWCCDAGRIVLLWILLCGCDRRQTVKRRRGEYFKKPSNSSTVSGAGIGYGSYTTYGSQPAQANQAISFGHYGTLNNSHVSLAQPVDNLPTAQQAEDEFIARLMACLDVLLPSLMADHTSDFDLEPPAPLLAVLTQSNILETIAALLRNDSLEDVTKRIRLYTNTLNVVDKLSRHHTTADLTVNQARQVESSPSDILKLSYTVPDGLSLDKYEEADSLASCLHNLDMASKSILKRAKAHPQHFVGGDSERMLSLCERVSQTADSIIANADKTPSRRRHGTTPELPSSDWQSELAVLELPDDVIMTRHTHATLAESAINLAGGRMKSLSLQLTNLTTSVPPGVFIRYCASRIDVMKVLVTGPKDTPYENGLFEFDLFCPAQFPNAPPKMQFRTTGGGRVRFNPNLYNDGKVCLSLLGTWTGPTWQPGKSTILQILVSIQAMIFCDEPWYNEPGRQSNPAASKAHNRELQGHTVRHAMLDWLKPGVDAVWADVVQKHFGVNAKVIEQTVAGWGIDQRVQRELREALKTKAR